MEGKKWHDWLTSIGTVIALILAGVSFYYQFMRKPRELRAVILPIEWDGGVRVTTRLAIWNDGAWDEVIESANLTAHYSGTWPMESSIRLLGPEVIKPGEAKAYTIHKEMKPAKFFLERESAPLPPGVEVKRNPRPSVKLRLELRTLDKDGAVIVSRAEVGELAIRYNEYVSLASGSESMRFDLLTGKSLGGRQVNPEGIRIIPYRNSEAVEKLPQDGAKK